MVWPPPKKKDIQIKYTPGGRLSIKCRHGWETADSHQFACLLWWSAWKSPNRPKEATP